MFKGIKNLVILATAILAAFSFAQDVFITVDQFGYRPNAQKFAVLRSPEQGFDKDLSYTPGSVMEVVDSATAKVVYSGAPVAFQEGAVDTSSGDKIWWFDFSSLSTPGTYYIRDKSDNLKASFYFHIGDGVYNDILKAAMRMMYYQRVGMAKEAAYAGEWSDAMNHEQDKRARLFTDSTNSATERDVSGGWFDAGDLNKYTIWNGNYIETLLRAYMDRPRAFTDDYNIPESGNGIPDILDEVKWGMDHLLRMQNADGSVLSVVDEDHASPPSAAKGRSYYGAPNAMSAYSAAKAFALGSIVATKRKNTEYATTLKTAALKAFAWAEAHPDSMFYNNKAEYGTKDLAAGQQEIDANYDTGARFVVKVAADFALYELTGDAKYLKRFEAAPDSLPLMRQYGSWAMDQYRNAHHMLYILYLQYKDASSDVKSLVKERFTDRFPTSQYIVAGLGKDGYRSYIRDYNWGSNSAKATTGLFYDKMSEQSSAGGNSAVWHNAAEDYLHYLHGVNPFGMVYLSNMGGYGASKSVTAFYHAWFKDNNPAPGYVTGGANSRYTWADCCKEYAANNSTKGCGSAANNALCYAKSIPVGEPHEKMYANINDGWPLDSWELTEPSLGYQTAYIRLISRFVEERGVDIGETIRDSTKQTNNPEKKSSSTPERGQMPAVHVSVDGELVHVTGGEIREIRIFDLQNRKVLSWRGNAPSASLDVSSLQGGVYVVRLVTSQGITAKIFAKH